MFELWQVHPCSWVRRRPPLGHQETMKLPYRNRGCEQGGCLQATILLLFEVGDHVIPRRGEDVPAAAFQETQVTSELVAVSQPGVLRQPALNAQLATELLQ